MIDSDGRSWALDLTPEERQKRLRAEFCEHCGATETQPCVRKNKTTMQYVHNARLDAAMLTYSRDLAARR